MLVVVAVALVVWRYLQERTPRALLEGCAVATIAFFVLATRMHERYLFNGLLFTIACIPFARRYLWGAVALTVVLFANLEYSLQYLQVVQNNVPGVNAQNLWGPATSVFSLIAVGVFFWLGYQYLGARNRGKRRHRRMRSRIRRAGAERLAVAAGVRRLVRSARRSGGDARAARLRAGGGASASRTSSCRSSAIGVRAEKVFDEIYFARAGEEYLQNLRIYENTHPPLTKLLVTLSMMLFGGMPQGHGLGGWTWLNGIVGHIANGDNAYGWRFLDVVFGALAVMLLYVFAKRITGSTFFACVTALLLTLDGMHFVQSRIATPEGFVVFFATLAVYAFYRFWISSQVGDRAHVNVPGWGLSAGAGWRWSPASRSRSSGVPPGASTSPRRRWSTLYVAVRAYLLVRYSIFPRIFGDGRRELSYGEGSYALRGAETVVYAADGGTIDEERQSAARRASRRTEAARSFIVRIRLTIKYARDASVVVRDAGRRAYVRRRRDPGRTPATSRRDAPRGFG